MDKSSNVVWHHASVTRSRRETLNKHKSAVLWFTGLSSSGKSTLAHAVEEHLHRLECRTLVLDGDNVRHGLCSDLGFADKDRVENIRRIGEVSKLFLEAGVITLTAFISPFRGDRQKVRSLFPQGDFLEVYCNCPLAVCESRDEKGLYRRARTGEGRASPASPLPMSHPLPLNSSSIHHFSRFKNRSKPSWPCCTNAVSSDAVCAISIFPSL